MVYFPPTNQFKLTMSQYITYHIIQSSSAFVLFCCILFTVLHNHTLCVQRKVMSLSFNVTICDNSEKSQVTSRYHKVPGTVKSVVGDGLKCVSNPQPATRPNKLFWSSTQIKCNHGFNSQNEMYWAHAKVPNESQKSLKSGKRFSFQEVDPIFFI